MNYSINEVRDKISELGYHSSLKCTNEDYPDTPKQLHVYKKEDEEDLIAKVSLSLACRLNMMFKGVGRNEKELFKLLSNFSYSR